MICEDNNQIIDKNEWGKRKLNSETEGDNSSIPIGCIPRFEINLPQYKILTNNQSVKWIMIDIDKAERLVKLGKNANDYFGRNVKIITTTTIHDPTLVKYYLKREIEIVNKFVPNAHIPCDRPIYMDQETTERLWILKTYVEEVAQFVDYFKGENLVIIPQIKGVTAYERKICYDSFHNLGLDYFSYYVVQYFKSSQGRPINRLLKDVKNIIAESKIRRLMLIGIQTPNILRKLPRQVIALAGTRWRREVGLRDSSIIDARNKYSLFADKVKMEVNKNQSGLDSFIKEDRG